MSYEKKAWRETYVIWGNVHNRRAPSVEAKYLVRELNYFPTFDIREAGPTCSRSCGEVFFSQLLVKKLAYDFPFLCAELLFTKHLYILWAFGLLPASFLHALLQFSYLEIFCSNFKEPLIFQTQVARGKREVLGHGGTGTIAVRSDNRTY